MTDKISLLARLMHRGMVRMVFSGLPASLFVLMSLSFFSEGKQDTAAVALVIAAFLGWQAVIGWRMNRAARLFPGITMHWILPKTAISARWLNC